MRFFSKLKVSKPLFYFTALFLIGMSVFHIYFAKKIIPGVWIGNVYVGGKTYEGAKNSLKSVSIPNKLILKASENTFEISNADVSLAYNWDAAVSRAFEVGRSGNLYIDNKDKIAGLFKRLQLKNYYELDDDALSDKLLIVYGELDTEAKDSQYVLKDTNLDIAPSDVGSKVDRKLLYKNIIGAYDNLDFSNITISIIQSNPVITKRDLEKLKNEAEKIVFNKLQITYSEKSEAWNLSASEMLDLLAVNINLNNEPELSLNKAGFEGYISDISSEVNESPRGSVTQINGDSAVSFKLTTSGMELDRDKFMKDFKAAFLHFESEVSLTMKEVTSNSDATKYGITSLLGEGTSKYTGSSKARIHNLTLAAERTNGVLVPPGGIYSFNQSVGEINGRTGYNTAYIISNGRTVLGEGGGVCQTSTTLFRAVLHSGLPVITRYPHAYRVHYYEEDSPIGYDASVYQPSLDFQFKNDTQNYVLVTSSANLNENSLSFKIYGTPDGRKVDLSDPVVTSQSSPPAPLYQDDPTLAKGVVRQVDFAAWGANVYFTRTVTRSDEVLYKDTFTSRYQPWRAVYLVGTKT